MTTVMGSWSVLSLQTSNLPKYYYKCKNIAILKNTLIALDLIKPKKLFIAALMDCKWTNKYTENTRNNSRFVVLKFKVAWKLF